MCGIAGIASRHERPIAPMRLGVMGDVLAHRGPDDAGYVVMQSRTGARAPLCCAFTDAAFRHRNEHLPTMESEYGREMLRSERFSVGFAHRRLSILDVSFRGHQPMASRDRRLWIAHNGEIYNFRELRAELEAESGPFHTTTDTEVILRAWTREGPACIERFDGMFAFAIFDAESNELFIARDRFGVKPVYVALTEDYLAFASEAKAILRSGLLVPEIRPDGLAEYCTFQNVLRRETIWKDIELLPAGHLLRFRPGSGEPPRIDRYVRGFAQPIGSMAMPEASEAVSSTFIDAVRRQMVADVPVGSFLSGGMDSGSIVAAAARCCPRLLTFTGGFDLTNVNGIEQGFDERQQAEQLSYLLQTEHYAVVLHAGDMPAAMERITWHMDDPRVGMCHQNWYVAKLASRFVKVCLAGTGGDELFAGYPWRYRGGLLAETEGEYADTLFRSWHRLLPHDELPGLFSPEFRPSLAAARESFDRTIAESLRDAAETSHGGESAVERRLRATLDFEFRTFLNGLLVTDDHISMAHSLETRVPFLDNALASLSWRLAPSLKINLGCLGGDCRHIESAEGKLVLRRAMSSLLPDRFVTQRKQGFSPPDENWYRGPSMEYIKSILLDRRTLERPWFDASFVRARLQEHFTGQRNHRLLIWSLLSLEWIQRHFVDAAPTARDGARASSLVEIVPQASRIGSAALRSAGEPNGLE